MPSDSQRHSSPSSFVSSEQWSCEESRQSSRACSRQECTDWQVAASLAGQPRLRHAAPAASLSSLRSSPINWRVAADQAAAAYFRNRQWTPPSVRAPHPEWLSPTRNQCSMAREAAIANQQHGDATYTGNHGRLPGQHPLASQYQPAAPVLLPAAASNVEVSRDASNVGSVGSRSCLSMCAAGTHMADLQAEQGRQLWCSTTSGQMACARQQHAQQLPEFGGSQRQGNCCDVDLQHSSTSVDRQHGEVQQQLRHQQQCVSDDERTLEQLRRQLAMLQLQHEGLLQEHSSLLDRHTLLQQQHTSSQELCLELMQHIERATREKQDAQWQQQEQQQRVAALQRQLDASQRQQQRQQQALRDLHLRQQEQQLQHEQQARTALQQVTEAANQEQHRQLLEQQCCQAEASTTCLLQDTERLSQLCTQLLQAAVQLQIGSLAEPGPGLIDAHHHWQGPCATSTGASASTGGRDGNAAPSGVELCCKALLEAQAARAAHAQAMAEAAVELEEAQQMVVELSAPGCSGSQGSEPAALCEGDLLHAQGAAAQDALAAAAATQQQEQQQQQQQQRVAELEGQLAAAMLEKRQLHARLRLSIMVGQVGRNPIGKKP